MEKREGEREGETGKKEQDDEEAYEVINSSFTSNARANAPIRPAKSSIRDLSCAATREDSIAGSPEKPGSRGKAEVSSKYHRTDGSRRRRRILIGSHLCSSQGTLAPG
jgi:hypothetical protein